MTGFPHHCSRMDRHEPHEWTSRPLGADWPRRTYHCSGYVLTEMELTRFDVVDDAAEERADRERREA